MVYVIKAGALPPPDVMHIEKPKKLFVRKADIDGRLFQSLSQAAVQLKIGPAGNFRNMNTDKGFLKVQPQSHYLRDVWEWLAVRKDLFVRYNYLLVLFLVGMLLFLSCSMSNRKSPDPVVASPAPAAEKSQPAPIAVPQPPPSLTPEQAAFEQARTYMDLYTKQRIAFCNGSFYWSSLNSRWGIQNVHECKHQNPLEVEGRYFAPIVLSEVERLNHVDPQPVIWQGQARAVFDTCRISLTGASYNGQWSAWMDTLYAVIKFQETKEKWTIIAFSSDNDDRLNLLTCTQVADYLRRYKP